MPTNTKVSAGFRSASRVVSESGRDGSATALVAGVELLALSKAYAPETNAATAIKIAILFISTPIVNILIKPHLRKVMNRRTGNTIWQTLLRNDKLLADFST